LPAASLLASTVHHHALRIGIGADLARDLRGQRRHGDAERRGRGVSPPCGRRVIVIEIELLREFFLGRTRADGDGDGLALAVADQLDRDARARRHIGDDDSSASDPA
jgi:hypothetical protein